MDYQNTITNIFINNGESVNCIKTDEDNFNYLYYYIYSNYKSKNKLELILKSVATKLNMKVYYEFEESGVLKIKLVKNKIETLPFENYIGWIPQNKCNIFLGVDENDNPIYCTLQQAKSILVGGSSGSGKSNLLHQIILSYLFLNKNNYLYLIDMKANELTRYNSFLKQHKLIRPVAYTYEEALKTITYFRNMIKLRFKNMMKKGERFSSEPPILLVIDEYAQLFRTNKEKKVINDLISQCASLGRASNCYLILATQHPTNDNINNTIRANLQSRIVLKCMNAQQSHNLLGSNQATNLVNPGDSIIHIDGKQPILAKTTYVSDNVLEQATTRFKIDC